MSDLITEQYKLHRKVETDNIDLTGMLPGATLATQVACSFVARAPGTINGLNAWLNTAPSGGTATLEIVVAGTVPASGATAVFADAATTLTAGTIQVRFAAGDRIMLRVQAGSNATAELLHWDLKGQYDRPSS